MPYLGIILELEFENNIVIFEITTLELDQYLVGFWIWAEISVPPIRLYQSTLEYVELQNFVKERKCLNLEPKMLYLGTLGLEF